MRILQIVHKPQRRGAEVFAFHLTTELRRLGHRVSIVYLYPHQQNALPLHADDICLGGDEQNSIETTLSFSPTLVLRLVSTIRKFKPDLVQGNGGRALKYGALCRLLLSRMGWALVYRNIGDPKEWIIGKKRRLFYEHFVMPQLDGIVAVSHATLANLQSFYDLGIPQISIPRGVAPAALEPTRDSQAVRKEFGVSPDGVAAVFVGSLTPEKRVDRLIRAHATLLAERVSLELWIVGDGPLRQELEEQTRRLGLSSHVHFTGVQRDVASFLAAANFLALSSDTEGLPGVVLEAGWLGRASVATNVGGVAEFVQNGVSGFLVEPTDVDFLNGLRQAATEAERVEAMGANARARVESQYTIAGIAQQYLSFYSRVHR